MKIYFAGSITGGRDDQPLYEKIITMLGEYGEVLTQHVGDKKISGLGENTGDNFIYNRDMGWLLASDIVVAEVTTPSLGVGYELAIAEQKNKKILCLYRPIDNRKLSALINGNPKLTTKHYQKIQDLTGIFDNFIKN